ncbi:MAG: ABC transporter ATP-binding protein [Phycisphaerae bacterium]|nr:ABC transporter ATP-binding protein [Phycisphaerae bacterium]
MSVGGLRATQSITTKKGSSPLHFLRVLRFSKPYVRYLYPAIACVVFVALTYSINIMALLPALKLIVDDQGIPSWVHQSICEKRLGLVLNVSEHAARVAKVDKSWIRGRDAPAAGTKNAREGVEKHDLLTSLDGQRLEAAELFRQLAYLDAGQKAVLGFERPPAGPEYEVTVEMKAISFADVSLRRVASWLPQETTNTARMNTLVIILGIVLGIGLVGCVCRFFAEYLISLVAGRTIVAVRRRMYDRVLKLPLAYFASRGISDTVSRFVQDSQDIYRGLNFVFAKSLREPLKALFVFILAMVIDWRITLITVIGAPLAGILIRKFGRMIRRANKRLLEGYGRMLAALEGALTGIRVVKGYAMENYERRHLHSVDQHMLKQQLKIARTEALASPVFETIGRIVATLAIIYFANEMFENNMTFAEFGTLAACMAGMFDPIRKMSNFYNRIQQANAAVDRVFEVIDMPNEEAGLQRRPPLPPLKGTIEFRNVRFTYPGGEAPAVDGIDLVIRRGERVAFVGPNGSGKTTLLSLLMRFFEPDEGELLFDGRGAQGCSIPSLRRQMSLVTQETVIFADTLANNIAYGDEDLLRRIVLRRRHPERNYSLDGQEQRIIEAAKAAHADEFIREKPDGYDTSVGEHGVTLSGGQRQRIAIARAILRNAPIFIFDEATSQVDAESERKIHDAVEKFLEGRTALIIAHRLSTILQADRIVVMDRGRIVDVGSHEELIKRCKLYQTLCGTQLVDDSDRGDRRLGIAQE